MLETYQRIVIKVGSATIIGADGSARLAWMASLAEDMASFIGRGVQVIIVTSGAVALGRSVLAYGQRPLALEEKQAAAAAGQAPLLHCWLKALQFEADALRTQEWMLPAQILLTAGDLMDRKRYLNARSTFETLLNGPRVVPIVNENDTVATAELRVGDNDRLAARVAQMCSADLLILLSDIDGLYTADPQKDPHATHIPAVPVITSDIEAMGGDARSILSSGGMATKIEAAKIATAAGCNMIIMNGHEEYPLRRLIKGEKHTLFSAADTPHNARKRWIAGMLKPTGTLIIDNGAVAALLTGKSLLAAGVKGVEGEFMRGDPVWIRSLSGQVIGKGLAAYPAEEAQRILGRKSGEIAEILGYKGRDVMIHRDDMALNPL